MDAKFTIAVDRIRGVLAITFADFWTMADAEEFIDAVHAALAKLRGRRVPHVTLLDVTALPIQSQDVLQVLHPLRYTEPQPRRMAIVVGGGLARLQMRRVASDALRVFYDRPAAEAWLFAADATAVSEPRSLSL